MKLIDIARIANVSKSTASRALADSPLVKDSTKRRVQEIAKQYNYRPNSLAQAVAVRKSGILGFCLLHKENPSFAHTFLGPVLDGALQEAQLHGYHLILSANSGSHTFDEAFIQDAIEGVIFSSFAPAEAIRIFQSRKIPRVVINDELDAEHVGFVLDDSYGGGKLLMEHLIRDCGRRRIAIISDRFSHTSYLLRYLAYIDALQSNSLAPYENEAFRNDDLYEGHEPTSDTILPQHQYTSIPRFGTPIITPGIHMDHGYAAVLRLIQTGDLPDAIFVTSDSLAVGVIRALKDAGIRVPEDIAVTGYDRTNSSDVVVPPLTTVQVNCEEIGRSAIRTLIEFIESPQKESKTIYIPNQLVIRGSTVANSS
ncbi:MAG: LacI family transcriptional regulator [Oscillibacter sp.]|nr:LacI family transcriptional regulator [Oscillibacter sp.]